MRMIFSHLQNKTLLFLSILILGGALFAGLWAYSWANNGDAINACVEEDGDDLYLIGEEFDEQECDDDDIPINWNVQGIQGLQGEQGPQGPKGDPGVVLLGSLSDANIPLFTAASRWDPVPGTAVSVNKIGDSSLLRVMYQISTDPSAEARCGIDVSIDGVQINRPHYFAFHSHEPDKVSTAYGIWLLRNITSGNHNIKLLVTNRLGLCKFGGDQSTVGLVEELEQ